MTTRPVIVVVAPRRIRLDRSVLIHHAGGRVCSRFYLTALAWSSRKMLNP
jgi:hypothetical protein